MVLLGLLKPSERRDEIVQRWHRIFCFRSENLSRSVATPTTPDLTFSRNPSLSHSLVAEARWIGAETKMRRKNGTTRGKESQNRVAIPFQRMWKNRSFGKKKSFEVSKAHALLADCDETEHTLNLSYTTGESIPSADSGSSPSIRSELTQSVQDLDAALTPRVTVGEKRSGSDKAVEQEDSRSKGQAEKASSDASQGTELVLSEKSSGFGYKGDIDIVAEERRKDLETTFSGTFNPFSEPEQEIAFENEPSSEPIGIIDLSTSKSRSFVAIVSREEQQSTRDPAPMAEIRIPRSHSSSLLYAPPLRDSIYSASEPEATEFGYHSEAQEKAFGTLGESPHLVKPKPLSPGLKRVSRSSSFFHFTQPAQGPVPSPPRRSRSDNYAKQISIPVTKALSGTGEETKDLDNWADELWAEEELAKNLWDEEAPAPRPFPKTKQSAALLKTIDPMFYEHIDDCESLVGFLERHNNNFVAHRKKKGKVAAEYTSGDRVYSVSEDKFDILSRGRRSTKLTLRSHSTSTRSSSTALDFSDAPVEDSISDFTDAESDHCQTNFMCQDMFKWGGRKSEDSKPRESENFSAMLQERFGISGLDKEYVEEKKSEAIRGLKGLTAQGADAFKKWFSQMS